MAFRFPVTVAGTISLLAGLLVGPQAPARSLGQDEVLPLVQQGEILPLETLLQRHRARLPGRLIDLELEYEDGRLVYELETLDEDGRVREFMIDAKSGEWLGEE